MFLKWCWSFSESCHPPKSNNQKQNRKLPVCSESKGCCPPVLQQLFFFFFWSRDKRILLNIWAHTLLPPCLPTSPPWPSKIPNMDGWLLLAMSVSTSKRSSMWSLLPWMEYTATLLFLNSQVLENSASRILRPPSRSFCIISATFPFTIFTASRLDLTMVFTSSVWKK